jgi:hypothetical protein
LFATFEQAAKQTQRSPEKTRKRSYIRALVSPLRHAVVVSSREGKMQTPSISIYAAAAAVVALLWYLSARRFRMASTSQELLDLFEERQAVLEEQATPSSSHDQGKASEFATAAASVVWLRKVTNWETRSLGAFVSAEKATSPLSLRSFAADSKSPIFRQRV